MTMNNLLSVDEFIASSKEGESQKRLEGVLEYLSYTLAVIDETFEADDTLGLNQLFQEAPNILRELEQLRTLQRQKLQAIEAYEKQHEQDIASRQEQLTSLTTRYVQVSKDLVEANAKLADINANIIRRQTEGGKNPSHLDRYDKNVPREATDLNLTPRRTNDDAGPRALPENVGNNLEERRMTINPAEGAETILKRACHDIQVLMTRINTLETYNKKLLADNKMLASTARKYRDEAATLRESKSQSTAAPLVHSRPVRTPVFDPQPPSRKRKRALSVPETVVCPSDTSSSDRYGGSSTGGNVSMDNDNSDELQTLHSFQDPRLTHADIDASPFLPRRCGSVDVLADFAEPAGQRLSSVRKEKASASRTRLDSASDRRRASAARFSQEYQHIPGKFTGFRPSISNQLATSVAHTSTTPANAIAQHPPPEDATKFSNLLITDVTTNTIDWTPMPSTIIQQLQTQVRDWNIRNPKWAHSVKRSCAASVVRKKGSEWHKKEGSTRACKYCTANRLVCVAVLDGRMDILPLKKMDGDEAHVGEERFWVAVAADEQ